MAVVGVVTKITTDTPISRLCLPWRAFGYATGDASAGLVSWQVDFPTAYRGWWATLAAIEFYCNSGANQVLQFRKDNNKWLPDAIDWGALGTQKAYLFHLTMSTQDGVTSPELEQLPRLIKIGQVPQELSPALYLSTNNVDGKSYIFYLRGYLFAKEPVI